jgi:hypothetical protein
MGAPASDRAGAHPSHGGSSRIVISLDEAAVFFRTAATRLEPEMATVVSIITESAAVVLVATSAIRRTAGPICHPRLFTASGIRGAAGYQAKPNWASMLARRTSR